METTLQNIDFESDAQAIQEFSIQAPILHVFGSLIHVNTMTDQDGDARLHKHPLKTNTSDIDASNSAVPYVGARLRKHPLKTNIIDITTHRNQSLPRDRRRVGSVCGLTEPLR